MISAIERRMEIVTIVNEHNSARVEDLAAKFNVSTVTIRNDLNFLEKKEYVIRSHGVAIPNRGMIAELSNHEKRQFNSGIKSKIGQAALKFISDGDAIILDSGTTTREIANSLKDASSFGNLLVMTNGLDVASILAKSTSIRVSMTGGSLRKNALSLSGSQAEKSLKNHYFNKVFLGVDGYDLRVGITTHNEQEATLNRLMCDISNQIIAVTDSSKFGKQSCHVIRKFADIDVLITDSGIPEEYLNVFHEQKIDVVIVD